MSCHDLISNEDIKSIYTPHIDEVTFLAPPACANNDKKTCEFDLKKDATIIVETPIVREYLRSLPLFSRDRNVNGKVVINKLMRLKENYRGDKLAKKFHNEELRIYHNNEFDEIQLNAAWDGIVVWEKLGFKFYKLEQYDYKLYTQWSSFFTSSFPLAQNEKKKIVDKYKKYSLIPKKYLRGFGKWLEDNGYNTAYPMYQVITAGGE